MAKKINPKTISTIELLDYNTSRGTKKKAKGGRTVDLTTAERFSPTVENGLSTEQVMSRKEGGFDNAVSGAGGKSYLRIVISNFFTYLNILSFSIFIAIIVTAISAGKNDFWSQCLFIVIIIVNTGIGIFQECRSKFMVDKLKLVTAPSALVVRDGETRGVPVADVVLDDITYLEMGKQICADAVVVHGEVDVNESMLTGESIPVAKKKGDMIFSGSFVTSGNCFAKVEKVGDANYIETLSSYAKKYKKPKSELNNSIKMLIRVVSIIMVPIAVGLMFTNYNESYQTYEGWELSYDIVKKVAGALIGMIPTGMFLLTSVALAASVLRLAKRRTLVQDLYCIEMLARVDVLCLDKTGTITDGSMKVANVIEFKGGTAHFNLSDVMGSLLSATEDNNQTAIALADKFGYNQKHKPLSVLPFSSQRKLSAVTFEGMGTFILGAPEFVLNEMGVRIRNLVDENAAAGYRVLCLAHSPSDIKGDRPPSIRRPVCLMIIEDHIREDASDTIKWFRENGVAVKVISGDNPKTVSEVARRVGVEGAEKYISLEGLSASEVTEAANRYTVFGRVTPDQKSLLVKSIKAKGHTVAMTGDGVNDILAMRQADCAVSIASGADAAKNVAHLVLLDNNFTSMPDVVVEGRRVINNISKSSSLFLMKTIMSIVLSVITLAMQIGYFFQTNMLMMLEFFVIGVPSFFLALQTNKNRIQGRYILNVLKNSVPSAVVLVINTMACFFFCRYAHGMDPRNFSEEFNSLIVISLTMTGYVMLIRLSKPFNAYRIFMLVAMAGLIIAAALFGSQITGETMFGFTFGNINNEYATENWLFLATIVMSSYAVASVITALIGKIKLTAQITYIEKTIETDKGVTFIEDEEEEPSAT